MAKKSAIDAIIQPFQINAKGDTINRVRHGKTARDKARGHIAYKKNRRIWSDSKGSAGQWVKV